MNSPLVRRMLTVALIGVVSPACDSGEMNDYHSGPSGELAFTSAAHGTNDIYLMEAEGRNPRRLTSNLSDDYWSSWSPDGRRLTFASNRGGNYDLYMLDVPDDPDFDGDEEFLAIQRLTTDSADDLEPSWSPDGRRIAFMSIRVGNVDVYLLELESGMEQRLTDDLAADWLPAWSPDGNQILFVSDRDGDSEIYLMEADGTNQRALTDNLLNDEYPAWSPDGSQISFACGSGAGRELCVMNVDGGNVQTLTNDRASVWVQTWSPDSQWIVFTSDRDGNRELYLLRLENRQLVRLTDNQHLDGIAAWRPQARP